MKGFNKLLIESEPLIGTTVTVYLKNMTCEDMISNYAHITGERGKKKSSI